MLSDAADAVAAGALVFGAAVWVGGFVTLTMVTRVATTTLRPDQRVAFFKALGRVYGIVAAIAYLFVLAGGGALLRHRAWDATLVTTVVVAAAIVFATGVGVRQARAMTRLRAAAAAEPDDGALAARVSHGARAAVVLRASIGALTAALIVLGLLLLTSG